MKRIFLIPVFLFFVLTVASGQVDSSFQLIKTIKGDLNQYAHLIQVAYESGQ